ncbi:MAG: prepilin-type N-terminal cleavage/methylation domain-containing protein [Verrucomicrobia bacterium]|nr:prepilin-type N-terminal cleavage/methylation domain-containing protein [Verrucomicrobiota bacterium]
MKTAIRAQTTIDTAERLGRRGFTLVELLVVVAVIGILAALLMPALSRSKAKAHAIFCLNNTKQLTLAWLIYADDHNDQLPYNLGGDVARKTVAEKNNLNWVNDIMSWELDADNTNAALIADASLGPYANKVVGIYRCPSDNVLSDIQRAAGWRGRVRSYSMNAMVGNAGELSPSGVNQNNPDYEQFFTLSSIPQAAQIFVFLDEHPDSINDGYFINQAYKWEWTDLPASYHNGAGCFSFADGHSETHRWRFDSTKRPARPDAAQLPIAIPKSDWGDIDWVTDHMSVER